MNLKTIKEDLGRLVKNINKNIDSLYDIATHDPKTGLHNYQFFQEMFEIEFEKAKRGNKLCLAIFDIDYFKVINTKLGHIKADKILKQIAGILKKNLRISDILARFGGEEFITILPSTSVNKARLVIERIRKKVESQFKRKVTISAGLAEYKKKDSKHSLKEKADKALFKAKDKGRNRVEVY